MEKITPETYIKMNEEFIEDDLAFRIVVPTQEEIDKWQALPQIQHPEPKPVDMIAEQWEAIGIYTMEERMAYIKNNEKRK